MAMREASTSQEGLAEPTRARSAILAHVSATTVAQLMVCADDDMPTLAHASTRVDSQGGPAHAGSGMHDVDRSTRLGRAYQGP